VITLKSLFDTIRPTSSKMAPDPGTVARNITPLVAPNTASGSMITAL